MYETEIWQRNIDKNVIQNNATIATLMSLLIGKGIITVGEFIKLREKTLVMEPYASALQRIEDDIAQYGKWKNDDFSDVLSRIVLIQCGDASVSKTEHNI